MGPAARWSRTLIIIGSVFIAIGAFDPLESSLIIAPGSAIIALGAFLGKTRGRMLAYWGFGLMLLGMGALWGMSAMGGIGGDTGRSMWWALLLLPYPAGWVLGLISAIIALKKPALPGTPGSP